MGRVLALMLIFCLIIYGQNEDKMLVLDEHGKAILRIFVTCEYKLVLKNPKDKEVKIFVNQIGNGFFTGEHKTNYDFLVSASHIFLCNSTIGELKFKGLLDDFDRNSKEDLNIENIVALKDGKISNTSAFTHEGIGLSDIQILFNASAPKFLSDPDSALLRVTLPEDTSHTHLLLMDDKLFDGIFYKDGIGKDVVVRGFLLFGGGWFLRYKNAKVEWVRPEILQINEALDPGLSGGPLNFFHEGQMYAIGAVSRGAFQQEGRTFDMSWASIIKKSFLEKRNKK